MNIPDPSMQEQFIQFSEKHLPKFLVRYLKRPFIWNTLNRILCTEEVLAFMGKNRDLMNYEMLDALIEACQLQYKCINTERIPSEGRLLVVANHPLGGADWLLTVKCISTARSDVKILINKHVTTLMANMSDQFIPIDAHATSNEESRKKVGESLEREEAVIILPAGSVSRMTLRGLRDRKWKKGVIHFARDYKTDILPLYIKGRFSLSFYLYPRSFRRLLLLRNLLHSTPKNIRLIIGNRISWQEFQDEPDLASAAARLKSTVYKLGRQQGRA